MGRVIYSQEPSKERRIAKGVVSCADHGHLASGRICAIHVAPAGHLAGRELAQTIQGRQIGVAAVRGASEISALREGNEVLHDIHHAVGSGEHFALSVIGVQCGFDLRDIKGK